MHKEEIITPYLLLDLAIFKRNLLLMRNRAADAGKMLRPHAKTHKCSEIAKRQLALGNCAGICTATVSEAFALIKAGITDVLITSPFAGKAQFSLLEDCFALSRYLYVTVDNFAVALELNALAAKFPYKLQVLLDLDPEMGRTGVPFDRASELAWQIHSLENLHLLGIQCYAGHLQHIADAQMRKTESLRLMRKAAAIFNKLKADGLDMEIFTTSGTGTASIDLEIPEITDLQVGSYCVMDAEYAALENPHELTFEEFRPALTLITTVISTNQPDKVTVDAGLKALYYTPETPPKVMKNAKVLPGWKYDWYGDEHGTVAFPSEKPKIGEQIQLCLPHCDPTIKMHEYIYVWRIDEIIDKWKINLK